MTKIKVLVTGNAIGSSDVSPYAISQYDFEWLISNPSALLWADKIILTPFVHEIIESETYPDDGGKISKSLNKLFEVAKNYNLLEIKSPNNIITEKISTELISQIENERDYLLKNFPKSVKEPPKATHGEILIEDQFYCYPEVWNIYANLLLAKKWNAQSLFSDRVQNYCKYKFGISGYSSKTTINAFNKIFSITTPQTLLFPQIVFKEIAERGITPCSTCNDQSSCESNYLDLTETKVSKYLELRDYDEIQQQRKVVENIIKRIGKTDTGDDYQNIIKEFKKEQISAKKELRSVFPKISLWANIGLIAATPFSMVGAATGLPIISVPSYTVLGLSAVTKAAIEIQKNRYKWVAFNKDYTENKTKIRMIAKDGI